MVRLEMHKVEKHLLSCLVYLHSSMVRLEMRYFMGVIGDAIRFTFQYG